MVYPVYLLCTELKCALFVLTDHRMYFDDSDTYPRTNNIRFHTQTSIENLLQSELIISKT
jgi:hypothetical protein